jgi:cytoskeletal protein CcmA (bactofilin family)
MAGRANGSGGTFSVIGADVTITGDIAASADLHVDGVVKGDITCAALVQGEDSTITGSIETQTARLAGKVHGSIEARELVILKSAQIEGDIAYDALTIEQGARVKGSFAYRDERPAAGGQQAAHAADAAPRRAEGQEPRLTVAS